MLTIRGACPPFPRNPKTWNDKRNICPDNGPKTVQKSSARDAPNTHDKYSKNRSPNHEHKTLDGIFVKLLARPPPRSPRDCQNIPLRVPNDAPRGANGGPRDPQRPPGPPPVRPKMAPNATSRFSARPLGPQGRPKAGVIYGKDLPAYDGEILFP